LGAETLAASNSLILFGSNGAQSLADLAGTSRS
jgi:hypothetical protein